MAIRQKSGIKKHDIAYLSFLAIAGSGLVTLLLFVLYGWYVTGQFPLLHGLPVSMAGEGGVRFWIGSIYVPLFLGFVGIMIAHRLLNPPDGSRLSPPLSRGRVMEMAEESDPGTLESVLDTLSGPDAAEAKYRGMFRNGQAAAGWGADHWQSQPVEHNDTSHASAGDAGPGLGSAASVDLIAEGDAPARNEADILELLKDPANREKLVALLTDAE